MKAAEGTDKERNMMGKNCGSVITPRGGVASSSNTSKGGGSKNRVTMEDSGKTRMKTFPAGSSLCLSVPLCVCLSLSVSVQLYRLSSFDMSSPFFFFNLKGQITKNH